MESVIVTVVDQSSAPVPGVTVQFFANPVTISASGVTDALGQVSVSIPSGDYELEVTKQRMSFLNPVPITVSASPPGPPPPPAQTFTVSGVSLAIAATPIPRKVRLFGYTVGADGQPQDVRVVVSTLGYGLFRPYVQGAPPGTGIDKTNLAVMASRREVRCDATGYWECDVIAGAVVRVEVPAIWFNKLFRVPNDPGITVLDVKDARPDPGVGAEVGITSDVPARTQTKGVT